MAIPNLQVALDHLRIEDALKDALAVGNEVDIIEAGTILILNEGDKAIKCLRNVFPDKVVIADTKCADAGSTVAKNCKDAGADWMTVICCATIPTMKAAQKEIGTLQVDLYGDWTFEQAEQWREAGIDQVIYHQSRDALFAGATWTESDLNKIKRLIEMGFKVSATGGLTKDTLKVFEGIDIYTFIAGRGIYATENPAQSAREFKEEIRRIWG